MKNLMKKTISILTALVLLLYCIPALAGNEATPTDLAPVTAPSGEEKETEDQETEDQEEDIESLEVIITKSIEVNETWEGKLHRKQPSVLMLDVYKPQTIHLLAEGKDFWATVQKSDRLEDDPVRYVSDSKSNRVLIEWQAEVGHYLITLGVGEHSMIVPIRVIAMDDVKAEAWKATIAEQEEPADELPETEPENPEETENRPESEIKPERHITVDVTWDVPEPVIGDTAHFIANLEGYDELNYTVQWQYSPDDNIWYDIPNETKTTMDVVVTEENNTVYWRILVFVEVDQES